ncbi:MAG: monofunctional biosynthetic peptidoglycan transglycosylase [Fibrobacter sp.]|nr:monofunctional biosynthetic peptidoglycan transglycosylase [Fibrobacter sp.]
MKEKLKKIYEFTHRFFKWFPNTLFAKIVKWIYRIINFVLRQALLVLIIYSAAFSIAASYLLYRAFTYGYEIYDGVQQLKDDQPEMSKYMEALQDSNPNVVIRHSFVPLDSISPYLRKAVIASEDAGFYFHPGFDVRAIAEALDANQLAGKTKFGGSTITQQLAKNLFLSGERSFNRKFKELAYALLMEHELGKDRILELYLNYAQWGKDIFGCKEACLAYYKKSCAKLSVDQAINMAAMLASPGKHHPGMRESRFMQQRRAVIYQNMFPKKDSLLVDSLKQLVAPLSSSSSAEPETKSKLVEKKNESKSSEKKNDVKPVEKQKDKVQAKPNDKQSVKPNDKSQTKASDKRNGKK